MEFYSSNIVIFKNMSLRMINWYFSLICSTCFGGDLGKLTLIFKHFSYESTELSFIPAITSCEAKAKPWAPSTITLISSCTSNESQWETSICCGFPFEFPLWYYFASQLQTKLIPFSKSCWNNIGWWWETDLSHMY